MARPSASPSTTAPTRDTDDPARVRLTPAVRRPNVLLLLTDDQTLADMEAMPRTSRLMGRIGTEFTHAISQYPLCCPARATLLTGLESHNHRVLGNDPPWGGFDFFDDEQTVPVWLQRSGYHTSIVGKYLQHYEEHPTYLPPGWSDWRVPTIGTYHFYNRLVNENGTLRWTRDSYQTSWARDVVEQTITRRAGDRPFFAWVSFLAPHFGGPVEPDDPRASDPGSRVDTPAVEDRYRDAAAGLRNPRDASFNEPDNRDKSRFMRRQVPLPEQFLDESLQQRRESLMSVDDAVVDIIRTLRRTGELDRTVVVFTSDNGFATGQHRWFHKVLGYEESIRVPLFVAGPGFARGAVRDQLVTLTDVAATFVDVAGVAPDLPLDGRSLRPLSADPLEPGRSQLLLEAGGWPFPDLKYLYRGVRTSDEMTYLRWYDGHEEVYDLRRDPLQLDGTVDQQEAAALPGLRSSLSQLGSCRAQDCVRTDAD